MAALQFDRGRPFPSQLLAFPRESPDVTAVERDAAKLGQRAPRSLAGPAKIHPRCEAVGTPLRANSSPEQILLDHAGFFRIFWEHSRRAPGVRARPPATALSFWPFCA